MRHGLWREYSPAGDWPWDERYYEMGKCYPVGVEKHWDEETGNISFEGHWEDQELIADKCYKNGVLIKCK